MTRTQNNLVVLNGNYSIANKEMKKELANVIEGLKGVEANTWKYAIGIYNIISQDLFKEDFETLKNFAEYIGASESTLNKMYHAVDYAIDNKCMESVSISVCYLLAVMRKEGKAWEKFLKKMKVENPQALSKHQLEDLIKAYKNKQKDKEIIENGEEVESVEVVEFDYDETHYAIPRKVLDKYKVEQ